MIGNRTVVFDLIIVYGIYLIYIIIKNNNHKIDLLLPFPKCGLPFFALKIPEILQILFKFQHISRCNAPALKQHNVLDYPLRSVQTSRKAVGLETCPFLNLLEIV